MSEWKRQTREISVDALQPEWRQAIQLHLKRHDLGSILTEALMGIQTDSEKSKKRLLRQREVIGMAAFVTPRWLVWLVAEPVGEPVVLSAQLSHVTVQDYAQTMFARVVPDSGIEISGMFTGSSEAASAFIGLEDNAAGNRFRDVVRQAAQDARK